MGGKSWGGKIAGLYAAQNSEKIDRLVLVCPALKDGNLIKGIQSRTLLCWCEDDWVIWFSNAKVTELSFRWPMLSYSWKVVYELEKKTRNIF